MVSGVECQLLALLHLVSIRLKNDRNSEWKKEENKRKKEGGKEEEDKNKGWREGKAERREETVRFNDTEGLNTSGLCLPRKGGVLMRVLTVSPTC